MVATIYSSLPIPSQNDKDRHCVLAIGGGDLKVQQNILQGKFLLPGSVEALFVVRGHSVFFKLPVIFPWPLDPFDNLGNDGIPALGSYPILVSKIPEVPVLLHDLGVPDNHLLIHTFTLFNHMNVGHLSPRCTTVPGIIEELGNGFLI